MGGDEVHHAQEVFDLGSNGAHAEYGLVATGIVGSSPSLSHWEPPSFPSGRGTVCLGIVRRLAIGVGETVLILGGAGVGGAGAQAP